MLRLCRLLDVKDWDKNEQIAQKVRSIIHKEEKVKIKTRVELKMKREKYKRKEKNQKARKKKRLRQKRLTPRNKLEFTKI